MKKNFFAPFLALSLFFSQLACASPHWTPEHANAWYSKQAWIVGNNYLPSDAINALEMWQPETFNPVKIDRELAWAQKIGMNSVRVFLHDLVWDQDPAGFISRIGTFLDLAEKHHIKPMLVLFDSCWDPAPHLGVQRKPVPGVHNSGWVQSPGLVALRDPEQEPRLKSYVQGVISAFARDPRILVWDLWNEPDNLNSSSYGDPKDKLAQVEKLIPKVFEWARSADPTQPLTSAVWTGDWSSERTLTAIQKTQLSESDVISFHSYSKRANLVQAVADLKRYHRPLFLTEYMARPLGSTIEEILPLAKSEKIAAYNWGFVAGKSQTYFPWDSWERPYDGPPSVWFHDLFYPDGKPYRESELSFILKLRQR